MDAFEQNKNQLRGMFPDQKSLNDKEKKGSDDTETQYYAIDTNQAVKRFKIILRSGETWSIPYSLLPVYRLKDGRQILIITHDLTITIDGRNLSDIEEYLSKEHITWLKESPSGKDNNTSEVFISGIQIEGGFAEK